MSIQSFKIKYPLVECYRGNKAGRMRMHATVILEIHVGVYFVAFEKCNLIIIIMTIIIIIIITTTKIIMGRMSICFVEILVFTPLWCVWLHPQIVSLLSQYGYFLGDIYMYWYTCSFSTLTLSFSHLPLPFPCAHSCHHSNLIASLFSYFCSLCFS